MNSLLIFLFATDIQNILLALFFKFLWIYNLMWFIISFSNSHMY